MVSQYHCRKFHFPRICISLWIPAYEDGRCHGLFWSICSCGKHLLSANLLLMGPGGLGAGNSHSAKSVARLYDLTVLLILSGFCGSLGAQMRIFDHLIIHILLYSKLTCIKLSHATNIHQFAQHPEKKVINLTHFHLREVVLRELSKLAQDLTSE